MRSSRQSRLLGSAAVSATFVALLSHVAGGGEVPGWLGIVVPWVLSLAVCTVLAGWRFAFGMAKGAAIPR